ncbi:MAG TPA: HlyD family efflux transporter periplasmic adaptor subunit [Isosphaeraceae bacterium]|jgi:multidrug resistance efflux pump|nr:HlyD family efflux transporter periplasmic adaptor subunit [Isosphaeraceae bacterium]
MFTKYLLPMAAVLGLGFAVFTVVKARQSPPPSRPVVPPPERPSDFRAIAGAGIVEARRENIPIGANIPGVVVERFVNRNDMVKTGDPLFRTDDRNLKAELLVREANLASARAQLERLEVAPTTGDIPTFQAAVDESRARFMDAEVVARRTEKLYQDRASAASDYDRDRYAFYAAKATLARAEADLERLKKTWVKDIEVQRAAVLQAEAQVKGIETDIERTMVRAPVDGQVLQVHVRLGQFAALQWNEPLVVLGDIRRLHVRVDIDEQDVPYYRKGLRAIATLKGKPNVRFPLEYVDIEPYVIPKQSLTGSNSERVDTRVLQVIYALPDERAVPVYIGQQMDVYLEAATPPPGVNLDSDPRATPLTFEDLNKPNPAAAAPKAGKP